MKKIVSFLFPTNDRRACCCHSTFHHLVSHLVLRFQEKFKQLLELQEKLGSEIDLIGPTTEILKEGPVIKISARNGQHFDRYLFLVRLTLPLSRMCLVSRLFETLQDCAEKCGHEQNTRKTKLRVVTRFLNLF